MTEPTLTEKIVALHHALVAAKIPHAFGGALALGYYAEPRATADIDVNLFLSAAKHAHVETALRSLGVEPSIPPDRLEQDGQGRVHWGRTPIDLFYAYHPFHNAMRRAARRVPFAG